MNAIFFFIVVIAFGVAAYRQLTESIAASAPTAMDVLGAGIIEAAKGTIAFCESDYRKQYPELLDTACELPVIGGE